MAGARRLFSVEWVSAVFDRYEVVDGILGPPRMRNLVFAKHRHT
jgi:hypothetical protein